MALNQEIWTASVQEILRSDNSFSTVLTNMNEWVNGHSVHIPQQVDLGGSVIKNNSSWPLAGVSAATFTDNEIHMNLFSLAPFVLTNPIEELEFNFSKRQSVLSNALKQVRNSINDSLILDLSGSAPIYGGSGSSRTTLNVNCTGNRSGITFSDIRKVGYLFNSQKLPQEGRYLLVPSEILEDLVKLTEFQYSYTLTNTAVTDGMVGKIGGFNIIMRDKVLYTDSGNTVASQTVTTTSNMAALAFHTDCVFQATGDIKVYSQLENPSYQGDVFSLSVRSVGGKLYTSNIGVAVLAEAQ